MTTILTDVANDTASHSDEDAFMNHLGFDPANEDAPQKKRKPSEEVENEDDSEAPEADADEETENSDESPEDEEAEGETEEAVEKPSTKKFVDSADHAATYIKVKEGDQDLEVSVKDLARLYGQEASLTRKSQEVADLRRVADEGVAKNVAALNVLHEKAKQKAEPYKNIDWLAVSKNPAITAADASALQAEAKAAFDDVAFFDTQLGSLMTSISDKQKADTVAQAKVCISALSTEGTADKPNPLYIKGWGDNNNKVYDDLRSFAVEMGADSNAINSLTDPVAFKLMHMAMQFKRGSSKVLTVKTKKSPTKIVKTSSSIPASSNATVASRNKAITKLQRTGSDEDGINAFLSSMGSPARD